MRFLLYLRMVMEGTAGFLILLVLPFSAIGLLHSGASTRFILTGWGLLALLFFLGIVLFRDAVVLRMRLKSGAPG